MKKDHCLTFKLCTIAFAGIFLCIGPPASSQTLDRDVIGNGRTVTDAGPLDSMTDEQVREIQARINENVARLTAEGKLRQSIFGGGLASGVPPTFLWPVAKASGQRDFAIGIVRWFVDHNPAFPDQILDWNCGTRTYDTSGANHRGTDIVSQSFPWKRMYQNEQYAVASAAGVIVLKQDGNFDQSCIASPVPTGNWNAVYLLHRDGSITWYGHLKSGSLTSKEVGDTVSAGEYLGVTGSSGSSTVPHLHFEVYDAANLLQDPYQGACNTMNNFSWWTAQEPYRNSQILSMYTASAIPEFPTCPQQEVTHEKLVFQPLDEIVAVSALRDLLVGQETQYYLSRPDNTVFQQWRIISPQTFDVVRIRWQTWQLPSDAPSGEWRFWAVHDGRTYERTFYVGQPPNVSVRGRITTLTGRPVSGARVVVSGGASTARAARTNPFGYYQIDELVVGATYNFSVEAKGLTFLTRSLLIAGDMNDFDHFSLNER